MTEEIRICKPTGKRRYRSRQAAKVGAQIFARALAKQRRYQEDLYAYPCGRCSEWHLTRMAEYDGKQGDLVYIAAPREIQEWGWRG